MRLLIAAVGRLKDGPERDLLDHYVGRLKQSGRNLGLAPIDVLETPEGRGVTASLRQADEAARLSKLCDGCDVRFVLDERGKALNSRAFASEVGSLRDNGVQGLAFLIGGPDGHGASVTAAKGSTLLSLGPMTLPHGLARIVLAEQMYRAVTILSGHPYHRD